MPEGLRLDGVRAGYRRVRVLDGITLALAPGDTLAVVGANGAGKTTLLRAIMGQIPLAAGTIRFDGTPLDALATHRRARRGIGYCPEGRHLFPMMSVAENLELGAARAPGAERRRRLERIMAVFPKLRRLHRTACGLLSGGEQQMVAVGRALMGEPRLLLLDEPSTGLAPRVVQELYEALRGLPGGGMAILLAEQNARAAMRFAQHCVVFENGRIAAQGRSAALLDDRRLVEAYVGAAPSAPGG